MAVFAEGSPKTGEPVYIAIGKIFRPHGIHGDVLVGILTDFPERIKPGKVVYIGESFIPHRIAQLRTHLKGWLLQFDGLAGISDVEHLRNTLVYSRFEGLPELPEGEYYFHELIGLDVFNEKMKRLGNLVEIIETGANDVYIIRTDDEKEILVPAVDDYIRQIDMKERRLVIHEPEWE